MIFVVGCEPRNQQLAMGESQRELVELQQRLKLLHYRSEVAGTGAFDELKAVEASLRANDDRVRLLAGARAELVVALGALEEQFATARHHEIQNRRVRAVGREWDEIAVRDGRTFEQVRIVAVEDSGVSIRHAHGAATLRYSELTDAQQEEFGMVEELANAAEERERAETAAFEQQIDAGLAEMRAKQPPPQVSPSSTAGDRSYARVAARSGAATRQSALSEPARAFGGGGYSRYRSSRPTYRYVYYYQPYGQSGCFNPRPQNSVGIVPPVVPRGGTGHPGGGSIRPVPSSTSP